MKEFLQDLLPPQPYATTFESDNAIEMLHEKTKWYRGTFNSQLRHIVRYLVQPNFIARGASGFNEFLSYPLLALPEPAPMTVDLAQILASRRSGYNLAGTLNMTEVSSLLHYAIRVNLELASKAAPNVKISFRPYPSPGGLYPTEVYVFLNNVEGVEPCIAHYDPRTHSLRVLQTHDGQAFARVEIQSGEKGVSSPMVMVMTTVPQRVTAKYGGRGYRMGLLEVGHASQNICLVAEGLGLGSLVYGSYFDDELAESLEIDSVTEAVASVILIGKAGA